MPPLPLNTRVLDLNHDIFYYNYRLVLRNYPWYENISLEAERFEDRTNIRGFPSSHTEPQFRPYLRRNHLGFYPLTIQSQRTRESCFELYLLLGDTPRSKLRILFVFLGDRPPELKFLNLSWHDMILDIDDYYANWDADQANFTTNGDEQIPRQ